MIRQTPVTCHGHSRPVVALEFSDQTPDGYYLISASKDGKPQLRVGSTGDWLGTFEGHKGAIWDVALSPNAKRAATGAADFFAKYWDAESGDCLSTYQHEHIVKCVSLNPLSTTLLTATNKAKIRTFDVREGETPTEEYTGHSATIKGAAFLKTDDNYIVSASEDKSIKLWDRRKGCEIATQTVDHAISGMSLNGDVLTVTYSKSVGLYHLPTLDLLRTHSLPCTMYAASLHPDKKYYVCGGEDFLLYKVDIETGRQLESYKRHFGPVHCVTYSPDGELYASGSEDGTIRLWQNTVGQNYGLWMCPDPVSDSPTNNDVLSV